MLYLPQLKVKIKSLAVEARIIRKEEKKTKNETIRESLNHHRRTDVREEARWAQLAYAFLRGREYSEIESKNSQNVNWTRVTKLVEKFGEHRFNNEPYDVYDERLRQQRITLQRWIDVAQLYRAGHDRGKKDSK